MSEGLWVTEANKSISKTIKIYSDNAAINSLITEFNKEYPNVTVEVSQSSSALTYGDINFTDSFTLLKNYEANKVLDLTSLINASKTAGAYNENDYYADFMKLGQANLNGAQLMIPRSIDTVVTHVNLKMLNDAGISSTLLAKINNGWTWEEFLEVCAAYKQVKTAATEYAVQPFFQWEANWNAIFESFGCQYNNGNAVNADRLETIFTLDTTGNFEGAYNLIKNLASQGYANKDMNAGDFEGGKVPFMFHPTSAAAVYPKFKAVYPDCNDANMDEYYKVVTFPLIGNTPKIGSGVAGYSIVSSGTADNEKVQVSWEFLKLMMSKKGQNIMASGGINNLPIRRDMADLTDANNAWCNGSNALIDLSAFSYVNVRPEYYTATTFVAHYNLEQTTSLINVFNGGINNIAMNANGYKTYSEAARSIKDEFYFYVTGLWLDDMGF